MLREHAGENVCARVKRFYSNLQLTVYGHPSHSGNPEHGCLTPFQTIDGHNMGGLTHVLTHMEDD
jgi:hypothetical protein